MRHKVNLLRNEPSRISEVMDGPWNDIRVVQLSAEPVRLVASDEEYAGFVIDGSATLGMQGEPDRVLHPGGAFALPAGGDVRLAAADGARLLLIVMNLAHGEPQ
jgi:hypothetical protein